VLPEKRRAFELRRERVWDRREQYQRLIPAGTVPTLVDENGLIVPDSGVICEYLEEMYPDTPMLGRSVTERVEVRRLVAWFDGVFARDVTRPLYGEKIFKRMSGRGNPDAASLRAGYANLRGHLEYLGWIAETRRCLAGGDWTLADFAAAAHLSVLDYGGDVDWSVSPAAKEWYARIKSRLSFRALLADRVPGIEPPAHYADLDF